LRIHQVSGAELRFQVLGKWSWSFLPLTAGKLHQLKVQEGSGIYALCFPENQQKT
jgi:hypothetical protein